MINLIYEPLFNLVQDIYHEFKLSILIMNLNLHIQINQKLKHIMKFAEKLKQVEGKLFINGEYIASKGKKYNVFDPSTEEVIGQAISATVDEVDFAVSRAKRAFNTTWRNYEPAQRGKHLNKLADLIQANTQWLIYFECLNNGKTVKALMNEDIPVSISVIRHFAGMADKTKGKTLQLQYPYIGMTIKQPIGVVGQIIPWNYPLLMMIWKIAPALAAGCTIVLKPAEQTPFTALMLGNLINQAGFPPGVINILPGGSETGSSICQHKGVDKISFTGSNLIGSIVMKTSQKESTKPITLNLGGKSANIICPDSDLDLAAEQACIIFLNNGQSCIAGSRTFVHESIYDRFIDKCIQIAKQIKIGNPLDEDITQGAIVGKEQFERILAYIEQGKKEGANLVLGGCRFGQKGFFIQPTIFVDVQDHMRIAKEEIFGPVMSIFKWTTEEEVIARANSLSYGLGAGVVTPNIDRAFRFMNKLHAGTVYVNCYDYFEGSTPFGGYKDSGIGKELGEEGLESYLLTKTVIIKQKQTASL